MNRKDRNDPRVALARAAELFSADRLEEAEAILRRALTRTPQLADASHLLGLVRARRGDAAEALALLERATALAPKNPEAWRNLAHVADESGDRGRAEAAYRRVLALSPRDVAARGCLAMLLEARGKPAEAIDELFVLLSAAPHEIGALTLAAKLLRKERRHEEEVRVAQELVRLRPGDRGLKQALSRSYFLWFDATDREPEKSQAILDAWLAHDPDDPVARHMAAARSGGDAPARAADAYVERHFDEFADQFDGVLDGLEYRAPQLCAEALAAARGEPRGAFAVLDLGCGTGKGGPLLRPWAKLLVGVDLSQKMLDHARARGGYDELVHGEITAYCEASARAFDVVMCTDTLCYFGDLAPFARAVARTLAPGGAFIATLELADDAGGTFHLRSAGRYAHTIPYVSGVMHDAGLSVARCITADLRMEYGAPTRGIVLTAARA